METVERQVINRTFWSNRRVFITGNTGFKGSWLSLWLSALGADVTGFALPPPTSPSLFDLGNLTEHLLWIEGDVRDQSALERAIQSAEPEIVFHLAAQPLVRESYRDPVGTYATNVMGTVNLLECVRKIASVRVVVNVTTDKCYENQEWVWGYRESDALGGRDPYSNSKGCAEMVTTAYRQSFFPLETFGRSHHVAVSTVRAGNVIGGGDFANDRLVPDFFRALRLKEPVRIRNPHAIRPWQHVLEPLSGYLGLAEQMFNNGVLYSGAWNFGPRDDDARPVAWIVETLSELMPGGPSYEIEFQPQPHEANYLKLDISKANQRLGWRPRWDLKQALTATADWYRGELSATNVGKICLTQINEYSALE